MNKWIQLFIFIGLATFIVCYLCPESYQSSLETLVAGLAFIIGAYYGIRRHVKKKGKESESN